MMKLCIDCKWMGLNRVKDKVCQRAGLGVMDVVDGFMEYPLCEDQRTDDAIPFVWFQGQCGKKARYFESK